MNISINIFEHILRSKIKARTILPDADMCLKAFMLCDETIHEFSADYLYVCEAKDLPNPAAIPYGCSFIYCDAHNDISIAEYSHINLLVMEEISFKQLLNMLGNTFRSYSEQERRFDKLLAGGASLQQVIDCAASIVEAPICLMDMNHNTLAACSNYDSPNDPFWTALKNGYGYDHQAIIEKSDIKIQDMIHPRSATVERISNISGNFVMVTVLFRQNYPVVALGIHKVEQPSTPFEVHTKQLYHYIIQKITKFLHMFPDIKVGRGKLYEPFLIDVIQKRITDKSEIDSFAQKIGLLKHRYYQLGIIVFHRSIECTDSHFDMMDYIERMIPECKCLLLDRTIYLFIPSKTGDVLSEKLQLQLSSFLRSRQCLCVLGPIFHDFVKLPFIAERLNTVLDFIPIDNQKQCVFDYYKYMVLQSWKELSKLQTYETMCHPMIRRLMEHDQEFNTDYLITLRSFICNSSNVTETAKELHVHRNSLLYRLKKIKELIDCDLQDWEVRRALIFSMDFLEFMETGTIPRR